MATWTTHQVKVMRQAESGDDAPLTQIERYAAHGLMHRKVPLLRTKNGSPYFQLTDAGREALKKTEACAQGARRAVTLLDNPAHDRLAAEFLRKHRNGVDTSEAYDDLRQLLASVRTQARVEVAAFMRGWEDGPGFGYPDGMCDVLVIVADQIEGVTPTTRRG